MTHLRSVLATAGAAIATSVAALAPMASHHHPSSHHSPSSHRSYTVALFGDLPYGPKGKTEYPRLLADMNAAKPAFALYDGDLKAGGDGPCTNAVYQQHLAWFNSLRFPVLVTPGDNDWTDCWGRYGPGTGGYDPEERLNYERSLFYSTGRTLGGHTRPVERQSEDPAFADYKENARFVAGPVMYVSVDFQGSNDNLPHAGVDGETRSAAEIARQAAEHAARDSADIAWLRSSFAKAKAERLKGVVVLWQADPNFNNEQKLQPLQYDGLLAVRDELRTQALGFAGQTLLVHGDSHYFKMDMPLKYDNGQVFERFTRLETFGDANTHWVQMTVDPRDERLFSFTPKFVPGNVNDR